MLTKNSISGLDFEALKAEHESALASLQEPSEAEIRKQLWLKQRIGKFTSSELGRLMTYEKDIDKFPDGAVTYVNEKVLEILTDGQSTKSFYNESMQRGNEKELDAIKAFEEKYGLVCELTGENQQFIEYTTYFGGTPDGLIGLNDLVEVKCPDSKTHYFRLRNIASQEDFKKHEKNYYWQIQGNLLATGRKRCFFIDFDDRFVNKEHHLFVIGIIRNESDIEKIKYRLKMAENLKQNLLKQY